MPAISTKWEVLFGQNMSIISLRMAKNMTTLMEMQVVIIQVFVELVKCGDMRWDIFELTKNINKNPKMVKVNGSNQIYYMIS